MKILVCVSKVPDTTAKISFTNNDTEFNSDGVQFIMNPTDEWYALVRAIELKEQHGGSVTLINVGGAENDQIIRKGLAVGADDAVRINTQPDDAYKVAGEIAAYAKDQNYDLIFAGKETIDYNGFEVGGMLAEFLDLPYVSLATHMEVEGNEATVNREIEGGEEILGLKLPAVISAQKGMAEQRIPNMRGIMQARTKPLQVVEPSGVESQTEITRFELPEPRSEVTLVESDNLDKLIDYLHNEAKAI